MWKTVEGSTGRLIQLCLGYFTFYVITGVSVKYFLGKHESGFPGMQGIEYLLYSTLGGSLLALFVVLVRRWYRLSSNRMIVWGAFRFPVEFAYIIPSGVCTAVVIPTTTLMYSLPISVMVAMVIMRGAIIVVGRLVDAVQIRQGLLQKKVYFEENMAVVFALLAVGLKVVWSPAWSQTLLGWLGHTTAPVTGSGGQSFEFLRSRAAVTILGSYVFAYTIRIYIMNYYKNTRGKGVRLNNKGFFAVEQISAFVTMVLVTLGLLFLPLWTGNTQITLFRQAAFEPRPLWTWAALSGMAFGIVAFFSVFIFMFKGRTATFAGLVNRLTSLIAGSTSTLIFHYVFRGRFPSTEDWISLFFILIAVGFLTVAERKRTQELLATHEIEPGTRPHGH